MPVSIGTVTTGAPGTEAAVTNSGTATFDITINQVNLQSSVTCGCTNGQLTYIAFDRTKDYTNACAWDTFKPRLK